MAFGVVLDYQCRLRWARYVVNEHKKEKHGPYTLDRTEKMFDCIVLAMNSAIPKLVYAALPDLQVPCIRWCFLPSKTASLSTTKSGFSC